MVTQSLSRLAGTLLLGCLMALGTACSINVQGDESGHGSKWSDATVTKRHVEVTLWLGEQSNPTVSGAAVETLRLGPDYVLLEYPEGSSEAFPRDTVRRISWSPIPSQEADSDRD